MNKPHNIALLLLSISMGSTGIAQAVVIDSPVSWAAHASTAVGNCTPACGLIVSDSEGGIDATSATASIAYPFGSPPDDAFAQATLSGTSLTPTLRARATSTGNDVEAFANGIQSYTNTGAARTIVLDLSLSANVTPGSSPGGKANATANLGVFLTDELSYFATDLGSQLEGERGKMVGADTANTDDDGSLRLSISGVNGYMTPVSTMFSFFVESGQSFLIWAGLEARADNGGNADATNTLTIDLLEEDGTPIDSSLLDIASAGSVSAVPLPAGAWLFLSGLILLASRRRLAVRDTAR